MGFGGLGVGFGGDALASDPCFQTLDFQPAPAQVRIFPPDAAGQEAKWQDCSG